jgi:CRP/FNR family transcriptional regulator, cyclic AMP receptor protein
MQAILTAGVKVLAIIHVLKQADIFYDLTATQLELVAAVCQEQDFSYGQIVFEENTSGSELFIIAVGEFDIQLDPRRIDPEYTGEPRTIARLRRGQSFGEVALVDEGLRSARAICAQKDSELVVIPRADLMRLCTTYPQMGFKIMRNLAADLAMKIRNTDLQMREYLTYTRTEPS